MVLRCDDQCGVVQCGKRMSHSLPGGSQPPTHLLPVAAASPSLPLSLSFHPPPPRLRPFAGSLYVISGLANIQNIFTFSFSINLSNLFSFLFTLVFFFSFLYFSSLLLLLPHFPLLSPLFEPWRPPMSLIY